MKFLWDVSDENRLCFQLCQKCIDYPVIDTWQFATELSTI